ncbi:MAG: hypothetical protein JXR38_04375 [Bacilli bacterium]|nr:hypothetical protein [Bacilli bacterium]
MKTLVKMVILALVMFALVSGGRTYFEAKNKDISSDQITLVDFDNSGDPDYVSLY